MIEITPTAALLLIDLQQAIDHPSWGVRNHPDAELRGQALLAAWRASGRRVFHIRHDSVEPRSHYRPGQPLHAYKPGFEPQPGETVIPKHSNSSFIETNLESELRAHGHHQLVVFGVITNNCVEATVRMAGNLGFDTILAEDACFTFGRNDYNGMPRTAEEVHAMSLANLEGEYARITTTQALLPALRGAA
ncbi:MAG: cysteine hydrolase [Acidobacteria bacterium]|nr:cysteine hydrolase [Acidobacteriota bacterium]